MAVRMSISSPFSGLASSSACSLPPLANKPFMSLSSTLLMEPAVVVVAARGGVAGGVAMRAVRLGVARDSALRELVKTPITPLSLDLASCWTHRSSSMLNAVVSCFMSPLLLLRPLHSWTYFFDLWLTRRSAMQPMTCFFILNGLSALTKSSRLSMPSCTRKCASLRLLFATVCQMQSTTLYNSRGLCFTYFFTLPGLLSSSTTALSPPSLRKRRRLCSFVLVRKHRIEIESALTARDTSSLANKFTRMAKHSEVWSAAAKSTCQHACRTTEIAIACSSNRCSRDNCLSTELSAFCTILSANLISFSFPFSKAYCCGNEGTREYNACNAYFCSAINCVKLQRETDACASATSSSMYRNRARSSSACTICACENCSVTHKAEIVHRRIFISISLSSVLCVNGWHIGVSES
mmetsp:Transcript_17770/g.34704  ORF Transcript_17770/g.34704 Transcript_17770/m.34704 type:complete len:409 (-) Transcript_17770:1259-2485(-)